jgi:hypothetical protein
MSLYIFGSVISLQRNTLHKEKLAELCAKLNIVLMLDQLDDDDMHTLDEVIGQAFDVEQEMFYFTISSGLNDPDATALWIEARALSVDIMKEVGINNYPVNAADLQQINWPADYRQRMQACRLGNFVSGLEGNQIGNLIAIALVDGGVERIERAPANVCIENILRSMILPWDCTSNTLYILER